MEYEWDEFRPLASRRSLSTQCHHIVWKLSCCFKLIVIRRLSNWLLAGSTLAVKSSIYCTLLRRQHCQIWVHCQVIKSDYYIRRRFQVQTNQAECLEVHVAASERQEHTFLWVTRHPWEISTSNQLGRVFGGPCRVNTEWTIMTYFDWDGSSWDRMGDNCFQEVFHELWLWMLKSSRGAAPNGTQVTCTYRLRIKPSSAGY